MPNIIAMLAVSTLSTMAHVPTLILRILPFREKLSKRQKQMLLISYGLALFANFCLYLCWIQTGHLSIGFYKLNLVGFCVVMGIVNLVIVKGYVREHLFTFGMTAIIVWQILSVSAYIVDWIGYDSVTNGLILVNAVGVIFYALLYWPSRKLMRDTVTPFLTMESSDYWNTIWFIPIAIFLSGFLSKGSQEYTSTLKQVLSNLLLGIAAILLCQSIARDYRRVQEKNRMNQQIELQKQYYSALTQAVQNEREVRHNFKHQLAAIRSFLDTGNSDELKKYCDSLELNLTDIAKIPYTKNAAADGVLYHYARMAKAENIRFQVRCLFDGLTILDTDLCCLLGNALDNAVTACKGYDGERYVTVLSEKRDGLLFITVDNSFDGIVLTSKENSGRILSKKRNNEEGIGIRSMEQICQKYHGSSQFQAEGTRFEASFLLKI